jgi:hypothetical protein
MPPTPHIAGGSPALLYSVHGRPKKENEESSLKTVEAMADLYSSRDAFLKEFEVHKRVVILCVDSRIGLEIFFPTGSSSSIDPREPLACKQQQQRTFFSLSPTRSLKYLDFFYI